MGKSTVVAIPGPVAEGLAQGVPTAQVPALRPATVLKLPSLIVANYASTCFGSHRAAL